MNKILEQNMPLIIIGVILFAGFSIYMAPEKIEIIAPLTITGLLGLAKISPGQTRRVP